MISNEPTLPPEPVAVYTDGIQTPASYDQSFIDPNNPPWALPSWVGVSKAIAAWIGSVACLFFVPLILVLPYFIYVLTSSGIAQPNDLMADKTFLFLSILGVIPAHILTFAIAYLVVTGGRKYPFLKTLGLEWPQSLSSWGGTALCALIALLLLGIGALITTYFGGQKTQLDLILESSYQARIATVFLAVVTGPFVEEVIYRGMLYPALARPLGAVWAVVLVSVLFAGVHYWQYKNNLAVVAVIMLLSVSLTIVRAITHRLLPSFVIHLVFNGVQSIFILLQGVVPSEPITPPPVPGVDLISFVLLHFS